VDIGNIGSKAYFALMSCIGLTLIKQLAVKVYKHLDKKSYI